MGFLLEGVRLNTICLAVLLQLAGEMLNLLEAAVDGLGEQVHVHVAQGRHEGLVPFGLRLHVRGIHPVELL